MPKDIDRRDVLKQTSIGISTLGVYSSTVTASETDSLSEEEQTVEVLQETDEYRVSAHTSDTTTRVVWVEKESGSARMETISTDTFDTLTHKELGIDTENISPEGHDEIIVESDGGHKLVGECDNLRYDIHQEAYLAFELGETVDELTAGGLEAAICAIVGAKYGGPVGAAVGAVGCHTIAVLFLDHIEPSGTQMTWGAWDCHRGWTGYSNICHGVTGGMADNVGSVPSQKRIPHTHFQEFYGPMG